MTTENKHTPGPWYAVHPDHAHGWWIVSKDLEGDDCLDASGDGGFNEGDARLIAAAPDLLEALEHVIHVIEKSENWWIDCPDRGGLDAELIRAAIAKARGQ